MKRCLLVSQWEQKYLRLQGLPDKKLASSTQNIGVISLRGPPLFDVQLPVSVTSIFHTDGNCRIIAHWFGRHVMEYEHVYHQKCILLPRRKRRRITSLGVSYDAGHSAILNEYLEVVTISFRWQACPFMKVRLNWGTDKFNEALLWPESIVGRNCSSSLPHDIEQ